MSNIFDIISDSYCKVSLKSQNQCIFKNLNLLIYTFHLYIYTLNFLQKILLPFCVLFMSLELT